MQLFEYLARKLLTEGPQDCLSGSLKDRDFDSLAPHERADLLHLIKWIRTNGPRQDQRPL
jgi:hypothetical protein